jgi:predicted AlkP superfamily pyrophosphatase or phosphodiesterase
MMNRDSLDAVAAARRDADHVRPLYETYGFARVPQLVRAALTGDADLGLPASVVAGLPRRARTVVVFLVDGLGWSYIERFADGLPFLRRVLDRGVVSKLTTQFPSTTAAHVTTLHTGLPVGDSGVFEWFYYEPTLDEVFAPLLHATLGPEGLVPVGASAAAAASLFPAGTLYEALASRGVRSRCYQHARYARTPYSTTVIKGAEMRPYRTIPEAMVNLVEDVRGTTEPAYYCVYVDVVDSISHEYGPDSPQVEAEIRSLFGLLEDVVAKGLAAAGPDALVLLTADHGHAAVDPDGAVYLDEALPGCVRWMKTTRDGRPLVPAGSARDMFLYVRDEHLDEAHGALGRLLDGRATVHRVRDLVAQGYFGPRPGPRLLERLGDLVVLPGPREMVWWRGGGRFALSKRGHHGGLSADEVEIPLLAYAPGV